MIRFIFFCVFICLVLTGCATTKDMQEVIVDKRTKTEYVFPDEKYLKSCEELPELKGKKPKDLFLWGVDSANKYDKCSDDKDILADWIKRFRDSVKSN